MSRRKRNSISSENSSIGAGESNERYTLNDAFKDQWGNLEEFAEDDSKVEELEAENAELRQQIETALLPTGGGRLQYRDFQLTSVGFELDSSDAAPEHWSELGETIIGLHGATQWLIGDWLRHDENNQWGSSIELAEKYDLNLNTLYTYRKIAAKVPFGIRIPNLSFGHHQLIAYLPEKEQRAWLQRAAEEGWSVAALRQAVRDQDKPKKLAKPAPRWAQRIAKVEEELAPERWQKLPEKERRDAVNQLRALLLKLEELED